MPEKRNRSPVSEEVMAAHVNHGQLYSRGQRERAIKRAVSRYGRSEFISQRRQEPLSVVIGNKDDKEILNRLAKAPGFERREEEHQSSSADSGSLRAPINVIANRIIQNASCVRKRELEQQTTPNPRRSSNVSYRQEQVFNSSVANQQPLSHSQKPAEVHPTIPRNVLQPSYDQSWVNRDVQQCHEEDEQRKLKEEHEQDRQWWANRVSKLGPERAEAHPNTCGLQHSSGEPCNLRDKADDVSDIAIVRPMVAQPDCGSQPNDRVLVQTNSFSQERHNNVPQQAREVRRLNLSISLSRHVENVNLDIRKLNREISISFHYTSSSQEGPSSSL